MGGKALSNTRNILQYEVSDTLKSIENEILKDLLNISSINYILIGSISNFKRKNIKDSFGDIDIGIDSKSIKFNITELKDKLIKAYPLLNIKILRGLNIISISWPISNTFDYVQLDLILLDSIEWAKFIYEQPINSKYKSTHRNCLLMSILAIKKNNIKDYGNGIIEFDGYCIFLNKGLFTIRKSNRSKIPNKSNSRFKIINKEKISDDPKKLLDIIFPSKISEDKINSFESLWKITNDFYDDISIKKISGILIDFLNRRKLSIPKEIQSY